MISCIANLLNESGIVNDILMVSHDELIIRKTDFNVDTLNNIISLLDFKNDVRVQNVFLKSINEDNIIEKINGVEYIRSTSSQHFLEVFCWYFGIEMKEEYLCFLHDGFICKKLESI